MFAMRPEQIFNVIDQNGKDHPLSYSFVPIDVLPIFATEARDREQVDEYNLWDGRRVRVIGERRYETMDGRLQLTATGWCPTDGCR